LLQAQLEQRQSREQTPAQPTEDAVGLGVYAENLSNGAYYNYKDVTGTYYGDRVALGWKNEEARDCTVTDDTGLITVQDYRGSETEAPLELMMPYEAEPQVFYLDVSCMVSGERVSEVFRLNHLRALQDQVRISSTAIRRGIPTQGWYDQTLEPAETKGLATLDVKHISGDSYELFGTLTPPSNCAGGYIPFFRLDDGTGLHWFLTTPDCTPTQYSEAFIYRPIEGQGVGQFSPSIALITFDGRVITNRVQERVNIEIDGTGAITYR